MPAFSRRNIAKALSIIGLKKTFIAVQSRDTCTINRLTTPDGELSLEKIATLKNPEPLYIGRVGMPDPQLSIGWSRSMTFYGTWFDDLATSDSDYRIRNNILSLPRERLLAQVARDDKYGLIGTYYAVFIQVLNLKKGLPLVLLDDSLLSLGSFPVIIPRNIDATLEAELMDVLRLFLRKEAIERATGAAPGMSVAEVSEADAGDYFPA